VRASTAGDAGSPAAPPIATIAGGGDAQTQRRTEGLLRDAGFSVCESGLPDDTSLVVLILTEATEAQRVGELRAAREAHPDANVLAIMPADAANASLRRVLLAGATGIVLDDDIDRALVPTAQAALAGQLSVPTVLGRQLAPRPLSYREKQILALVVQGRTNREIAHKLFLAESTVKTHLSSAFRKLDARSRSEAVTHIMAPDSSYRLRILEITNDSVAASG
jgi:DNA-binding NarL/FixJ family response regulator